MSNYDSGIVTMGFPITPSASPLANPIRGFHVGTAGDVNVTLLDGTTVLFKNCQTGAYYPYACTHVLLTSTTATNLVGLR